MEYRITRKRTDRSSVITKRYSRCYEITLTNTRTTGTDTPRPLRTRTTITFTARQVPRRLLSFCRDQLRSSRCTIRYDRAQGRRKTNGTTTLNDSTTRSSTPTRDSSPRKHGTNGTSTNEYARYDNESNAETTYTWTLRTDNRNPANYAPPRSDLTVCYEKTTGPT